MFIWAVTASPSKLETVGSESARAAAEVDGCSCSSLCCSLAMLVKNVAFVGCSMCNWWAFVIVRHEEDCEPESELDSDEISKMETSTNDNKSRIHFKKTHFKS